MSMLTTTLGRLAAEHVAEVLSEERDTRLIFPGLTETLAIGLHEELRRQVASKAKGLPVYLALDYPSGGMEPDENRGRLHYEALTSVRQGSFIVVCMPKVLPKLQDSIRGSGGPIRGVAFSDEWPWKDDGAEAFRFDGPVLASILRAWTEDMEALRWIREITLQGLLPATAPLKDAVRVPLLLETIIGSFSTELYPELQDTVEKFLFHSGIPRALSREDLDPGDLVESIGRVAGALDEQRQKNPEFRDHLVRDVAASTFASLGDAELTALQDALDLALDGVFELGPESGVLAFRGGLGVDSSSGSVSNWRELDIDRLQKLLGVGERDRIHCVASVPDGDGFVSSDGKHVAVFEGTPVQLDIDVELGAGRSPENFVIRCKRRQRVVHESCCGGARCPTSVLIPGDELPGTRNRISLAIELVRFQQVVGQARIYVHVCGEARPAFAVFEPGFDVVELLEAEPEEASPDSVSLSCTEPVKVHVLDWQSLEPCRILADDRPLEVTQQHGPGGTWCWAQEAIDTEKYPGARVDLYLEASNLEREVTLAGEDVEPGEFSLEDELRVATALSSSPRLRRVLPFFRGDGDLVLPKLGDVDAASRCRMDMGRHFEDRQGWRPVMVDFLRGCPGDRDAAASDFWRSDGPAPAFVRNLDPCQEVRAAISDYAASRAAVLQSAKELVRKYTTPTERPVYAVSTIFRVRDCDRLEAEIVAYLEAYSSVLLRVRDGDLSAGELFTLLNLDCVVLESEKELDAQLNLRIVLLGPWHPLVVAKRFMVQQWLYLAADSEERLFRSHRRLASLFERVAGFRVVLGFDPDALGLDLAFAFPTSDPGWHLAVASGAFQALASSSLVSLQGLGRELQSSLGLRSPLFEAGADLWSESFVHSYQRSHPSRQQLGLRIKHGLDPRPVVDSCCCLLDDASGKRGDLAALLPGGIHLFLEDKLPEREPLRQPRVFVYEDLSDSDCYSNFRPDILLLPPREETRPIWLGRTQDSTPVPRGSGPGAAFFLPLVDLSANRDGLPVSRLIESGEGSRGPGTPGSMPDGTGGVGEHFCAALGLIDSLAASLRPHRPALVQELGLPPTLDCDWSVLPGSHVDAGALASYVASGDADSSQGRALWDYRLDIGRTVSSYFIVCRVPESVFAALAANPLSTGLSSASSVVRELAEVGFAVGETMRSGKAAVGVLGVVGALRIARAAWRVGESASRRWCTVLLPVDCFTDLLVPPSRDVTGGKRTDLLALNLAWNKERPRDLTISPCAIECKYVSGVFPKHAVADALSQAQATYNVVRELLLLSEADNGMHARLALAQIVRFGLRLLNARREVELQDEQVVLDAILSGRFSQAPSLTPTMLVTTSCGGTRHAALEIRDDGWWISLSQESWPQEIPPRSSELVAQVAQVFAATSGVAPGEPPTQTLEEPAAKPRRSGLPPAAFDSEASPPRGDHDAGDGEHADGSLSPAEAAEVAETSPAQVLIHGAFRGFVGNRAAVEALSIQLRYAETTGTRAIRDVGLFGPKSTGKTELSRRLASALNVPPLFLSEAGLKNIDQLAQRMQECAKEAGQGMRVVDTEGGQAVLRCPPMLIFIDEVHQLNARVQDTLLPVLEPDDRTLRGSTVTIDAQEVTFVIATTDWGKLREPFRSRVRAIKLEPYTAEEVSRMLRFRIDEAQNEGGENSLLDPSVSALGEDALLAIATAARAVPRVALDLLREIGMALRIRLCEPTGEAVWSHLRRLVPCDRNGLTTQDHEYLRIVGNRGPVGLENIATQLGTDRSNVERAIEPFLIQSGLVQRVANGRKLTAAGRQLVVRMDRQRE